MFGAKRKPRDNPTQARYTDSTGMISHPPVCGEVSPERQLRGGLKRETTVSIVRIGLAETKDFSEGWEAIFGKKKKPAKKAASDEEGQAEKSHGAQLPWFQQFHLVAPA